MRTLLLALACFFCIACGRRVQLQSQFPVRTPVTPRTWHVVQVALPRRAASVSMASDSTISDQSVASDAKTQASDENAEECVPVVPYFCNEEGCWIGTDEDLPPPPVVLPDGRKFCADVGAMNDKADKTKKKERVPAPQGVFAPAVLGAKAVMGTKELNKLRAEVIAQHTKVITAFVDTSESQFGQLVLQRMFEAADKDDNGTLDREEIREALHALGFTFIKDKQLDQIFKRGDVNGDQVIDFEEFVKETPKTLRSSLVKLAKQNGHDLGFLA